MFFNKPRAIEYMRRYDLDVLVATSPANITYFTDYRCWLDPLFKEYMTVPGASSSLGQGYAVFPLEGEPALVVNADTAVNATDLWVRDLYLFGDPCPDYSLSPKELSDPGLQRIFDLLQSPARYASATEALLGILQARGLGDARIGLDMEGLTPQAKEEIRGKSPKAAFKDCTNLIRLLRAVKSQDEIALLTRAAEINEQAAMESLALARPGRPVAELIQFFRARVAEFGADFDHYQFGMAGLGGAVEPNVVLADDDILEVDFGCIYRGCFSDTGTTLAIRKPSAVLLARHAALRDSVKAAMDAIAPGVKASAVHGRMQETMDEHGIAASYMEGHSLGLEIRDYPIIVADNGLHIRDDCLDVPSDLPLEANMVFNLEAGIRMPGVGSLHIEQSFLVTAQGSQHLVPQARTGPFVPTLSPI